MHAFVKIFNSCCCKYIRIFLDEFCRYIIRLWSFLGVKVFDFFNDKRLCYFLKLKLGFSILSIWFLMAVILGCLYFSIIDVKEFVSDVVTSLTLYALISRSGTMLTKNSLKVLPSAFSDAITVHFSIREIVLHILTLFPNTGFTVFQNLFVSNIM